MFVFLFIIQTVYRNWQLCTDASEIMINHLTLMENGLGLDKYEWKWDAGISENYLFCRTDPRPKLRSAGIYQKLSHYHLDFVASSENRLPSDRSLQDPDFGYTIVYNGRSENVFVILEFALR